MIKNSSSNIHIRTGEAAGEIPVSSVSYPPNLTDQLLTHCFRITAALNHQVQVYGIKASAEIMIYLSYIHVRGLF